MSKIFALLIAMTVIGQAASAGILRYSKGKQAAIQNKVKLDPATSREYRKWRGQKDFSQHFM